MCLRIQTDGFMYSLVNKNRKGEMKKKADTFVQQKTQKKLPLQRVASELVVSGTDARIYCSISLSQFSINYTSFVLDQYLSLSTLSSSPLSPLSNGASFINTHSVLQELSRAKVGYYWIDC